MLPAMRGKLAQLGYAEIAKYLGPDDLRAFPLAAMSRCCVAG